METITLILIDSMEIAQKFLYLMWKGKQDLLIPEYVN